MPECAGGIPEVHWPVFGGSVQPSKNSVHSLLKGCGAETGSEGTLDEQIRQNMGLLSLLIICQVYSWSYPWGRGGEREEGKERGREGRGNFQKKKEKTLEDRTFNFNLWPRPIVDSSKQLCLDSWDPYLHKEKVMQQDLSNQTVACYDKVVQAIVLGSHTRKVLLQKFLCHSWKAKPNRVSAPLHSHIPVPKLTGSPSHHLASVAFSLRTKNFSFSRVS